MVVVWSGFKKGKQQWAGGGKRDASHFSSVTLHQQSVKSLWGCCTFTTYMSLVEEGVL